MNLYVISISDVFNNSFDNNCNDFKIKCFDFDQSYNYFVPFETNLTNFALIITNESNLKLVNK